MFAYSKYDRTTFTDPELVEYLIEKIYERGYGRMERGADRMKFEISGTVQEAETGSGIPGVIISALDSTLALPVQL